MEQWEVEAIEALLETKTKEVEEFRVYLSSPSYGTSRYHLVEELSGDVQIEQIDTGEKWSKRINFEADELPGLIKTLLTWHLEQVRAQRERAARAGATSGSGDFDDLGDLGDHPF